MIFPRSGGILPDILRCRVQGGAEAALCAFGVTPGPAGEAAGKALHGLPEPPEQGPVPPVPGDEIIQQLPVLQKPPRVVGSGLVQRPGLVQRDAVFRVVFPQPYRLFPHLVQAGGGIPEPGGVLRHWYVRSFEKINLQSSF